MIHILWVYFFLDLTHQAPEPAPPPLIILPFSAQLIISVYQEAENDIHLGNLGFHLHFQHPRFKYLYKTASKNLRGRYEGNRLWTQVMYCTPTSMASIILRAPILPARFCSGHGARTLLLELVSPIRIINKEISLSRSLEDKWHRI